MKKYLLILLQLWCYSICAQITIQENSINHLNACDFTEKVIQVTTNGSFSATSCNIGAVFNSMSLEYDQSSVPPTPFISGVTGCTPLIGVVTSSYSTGLEIEFPLTGLGANCSFELHYFVKPECDVASSVINVSYTADCYNYTSAQYSFQAKIPQFSIPVNGILTDGIPCGTPGTNVTLIGQTFTRRVTIQNNGSGTFDISDPGNQQIIIYDEDITTCASKFYHVDDVQCTAPECGTPTSIGSVVTVTPYKESIILDEADILLLTGDGILTQGEAFAVDLILEVDACMCDNIETSSYTVSYKCNDTDPDNCIEGLPPFNCQFNKTFQTPNLTVVFQKLTSNTCYNSSGASQMMCTITNTGSGTASNLDLELFFTSITNQNTYYSNFVLSGTAVSPGVTPGASNNFGCATSPSQYSITALSIPPLGGNLIVTWDAYTCCPIDDCNATPIQDGWSYQGTYNNQCGGNLNINTAAVVTPKTVNKAEIEYEGPNDVDDVTVDPFVAEFTITGAGSFAGSATLDDQEFEIQIDLTGPDLYFVNTGSVLGDLELYIPALGMTFTPYNVTSSSVVCGGNTYYKQMNAFFNNEVAGALRMLDMNPAGTLFRLDDAIIRFKFRATCDCPLGGSSDNIDVKLFHRPDLTCAPECKVNIGCQSVVLDMHCPGCRRQGIHSLSYDIRRITFGYQDSNNNSRWEDNAGNPQQVDASYLNSSGVFVKQKRAMVGDMLEGVLSTSVVIDPNYGPWYGAQPDYGFGLGELTYGKLKTTVTYPYPNGHLTPQEITVEIKNVYDLNGTLVTNPLNGGLSEWVIVIPGNQMTEPTYVPGTPSVYSLDISMSILDQWYFANTGVNLPYAQYRNGMSIKWKVKWLVDGNIGAHMDACYIDNLIYLGLHDESVTQLVDPDCLGLGVPSDWNNYCNTPYVTGCSGTTPPPCEDFQWYCTQYGGLFTMVGYKWTEGFQGAWSLNHLECTNFFTYIWKLNIGDDDNNCPGLNASAGRNAFPFEFRNWIKMDNTEWQYPPTFIPATTTTLFQRHCNGFNCTTSAAGGITGTGINPLIFDYLSTYSSGIDPLFIDAGTEMVNTDDDFEMEDRYYFSPTCASSSTQFEHSYFTRTVDITGEGNSLGIGATVYPPQNILPVAPNPEAIPYPVYSEQAFNHNWLNPPVLTLSSSVPNAITPVVCWDVVIHNTSTGGNAHTAANVWFSLPPFMNGITITSAAIGSGAPFTPSVNTTYHVGSIGPNGTVTIHLCGTWDCENAAPTFDMCTGWNCGSYPLDDNPANALCTPLCSTFELNVPFNAGLDAELTPPASIAPCTTGIYMLEIKSNAYNYIKDISVSVDFPTGSGISYVPGSAKLCYPGSGCTYASATTLTSAPSVLLNTLTWDLNSVTPAFPDIVDGVPGVLTPSVGNDWHLYFYFEITTSCQVSFDLADYLKFHVSAKTNCDDQLDWGDFLNNPYLTASSSPFDNLSIATYITPFTTCSNTTQGTVTVTNNSTTQTADHCNNFVSVTIPNGYTASNISNGGTFAFNQITWPASVVCNPGIIPSGSITLTFDLTIASPQDCDDDFISNIQVVDQLSCGIAPPCNIDESLSYNVSTVTLTPPVSTFTLPSEAPCAGDIVDFSVDVVCPGVQYTWSIDGNNYSGNSTNYVFNGSGVYPIQMVASFGSGGCSSTTSEDIEIVECITCDDFSISIEKKDCDFTFTANFPTNPNCMFELIEWDFGDGGIDAGTTVTHTYASSGTYIVTYHYTCYDGVQNILLECRISDTITVECAPKLFCMKIDNLDFYDVAASIQFTADGGLIAVGTMNESANDKDAYVAKLSSGLNPEYTRRIGAAVGNDNSNEEVYTVLERNGLYYIAGKAQVVGAPTGDVFMACIDLSLPNPLKWANKYMGARNDVGVKLVLMPDDASPDQDKLLLIGYTSSFSNNGNYDVFAMKTDLDGNSLQVQTYSELNKDLDEFSADAIKLKDKREYVIVGRTIRNSINTDVLAFKIDNNLDIVPGSYHNYGHNEIDMGFGVVEHNQYLYVVGKTNSALLTTAKDDIYLLELEKNDLTWHDSRIYGVSTTSFEEGYKIIRASDNNLIVIGNTLLNKDVSPYREAFVMSIKVSPFTVLHLNDNWFTITDYSYNEFFFGVSETNDEHLLISGSYNVSQNDGEIFLVKARLSDGYSCCLNPKALIKKKGGKIGTPPTSEKKVGWHFIKHGADIDDYNPQFICEEETHHVRLNNNYLMTSEVLIVRPNPTTGLFNASLITKDDVIKHIQVYDMTGRTIREVNEVNNSQMEISLLGCNDGIYYIKVIANSGATYTGKIVLTK